MSEKKADNKKIIKEQLKYFGDFHDAAFRILLIDDKVGSIEYSCKDIAIKNAGEPCDRELAICKACAKTIDKKNKCVKEYFDITEIGCLGLQIIQCDDKKDCRNKQCKLCTIKRLMDDGKKKNEDDKYVYSGDDKKSVFGGIGDDTDYFYWQESEIECYYCPTIIKDFIGDDTSHFSKDPNNYPKRINVYTDDKDKKGNGGELDIKCFFSPNIYKNENKGTKEKKLHVQIVGVRDVRTALLLLSKFKFDMVFCDYLLDYKDKSNSEREYAKQLLSFLSYDYEGEIKQYRREITKELDKAKKEVLEKNKKRLDTLNQLRHDVLDNRGPLDKLWIMPITGFNQTFIQDLYRNHVDLISSKWNISNGADPITTPWQFLYHLNKFVELQLKQCVYRMDHLLRFLLYTWEDLDAKLKENDGHGDFYAFQAFMGSEYANFMRRYGNRHIIQRDAYRDDKDVTDDKSVFATYIWNRFYADSKNRDVIELNRLIHKFFHQAATMHNDRNGQQRLEETFGQLCFFIDTNQKVRDAIEDEDDLKDCKLDNALKGLREKLDKLTSNRHDDENHK